MEPGLPEFESVPALQPDRRAGQRYTLILRAGKLICAAGEFLCVLRDVSDKGLKARLFHPLPQAGSFELELCSGERFGIEPIWTHGQEAGFRFVGAPVDVQTLLAESGPFPKRHIRLRIARELPVLMQADNGASAGRVLDISQHGALVELGGTLAIGQKVLFDAPGIPALQARVRWRRRKCHGVVFQQGFRLDELAQLVATLQIPAGAAMPPVGVGGIKANPALTIN